MTLAFMSRSHSPPQTLTDSSQISSFIILILLTADDFAARSRPVYCVTLVHVMSSFIIKSQWPWFPYCLLTTYNWNCDRKLQQKKDP